MYQPLYEETTEILHSFKCHFARKALAFKTRATVHLYPKQLFL